MNRAAKIGLRQREHGARALVGEDERAGHVHHELSARGDLERGFTEAYLPVDAAARLVRRTILRDEKQTVAQVETRARHFREDAASQIERREGIRVCQQRLGAAEEENAAIIQREMKATEDV